MSNYNIDPYFDDFNKTKNYVKILFKPGVAVQARELTQLQTAIQEQIKQIGGFLFKNESLVTGGKTQVNIVSFIDVIANDVSSYVNKILIGQTSSARIRVINFKNNVGGGRSRLYFNYEQPGILVENETLNENAAIATVSPLITDSDFTGNGSAGSALLYKLFQSVFYVKDYFVYAEEQTIILSDDPFATTKVGLQVTETIVTYQDDETLLDPASGVYNYAAPGADRVQISLDLKLLPYDPTAEDTTENMVANTDDNFIELDRFIDGKSVAAPLTPELGELEKILARRTYDESGDYTVRDFAISVKPNKSTNDSTFTLEIGPGKAYVKGFEFENRTSYRMPIEAARKTKQRENAYLQAKYGDYFIVNAPTGGALSFSNNLEIKLRNSGNTEIGTALVNFVQNETTSTLRVYVINVSLNPAYKMNDVTNLFRTGGWTATVVADPITGDKLRRGIQKEHFLKFFDSPISAMSDLSYVAQAEVTSIAGTGVLTISAPVAKEFISTLPIDYVVFNTLTGAIVASNTFTVQSFSSSSVTLSGTFVNGTNYTVYTKVRANNPVAKKKIKKRETVYLTNSSTARSFSLGVADAISIAQVRAINSSSGASIDVTGKFELDNGQLDTIYEYASIKLKQSAAAVSSSAYDVLSVVVDYFDSPSEDGFFSVASYDQTNEETTERVDYREIPSYKSTSGVTVSLRDVIDFRPVRLASNDFPGTLQSPMPTSPAKNAFVKGNFYIYPGEFLVCDYEFYMARIDKLILTKEKRFDLIKGISSERPDVPTDISDAMTLAVIKLSPYTFSEKDLLVEKVENRRYTMRDIGKFDKRIRRLEYYTAMSLLEKQAAEETVLNSVGVDKFKNGILVDPFAGHGVGDVGSPFYRCSIDPINRVLRPQHSRQNIELDVSFSETNSTDYSYREGLLTLPYTTTVLASNTISTSWINCYPFLTFNWVGEMKMNPPSDTWSETTVAPMVVTNLNGDNDVYTILTDTVTNPSSSGTKWLDWVLLDKGLDPVSTSTSTDNVTYSMENGRLIQTTATTTVTETVTQVNETYYQTGIQTDRSDITTNYTDLGSKIIDASLLPYIRSRLVDFFAYAMKPNTKMYTTFDGIDVSQYCTPAPYMRVSAFKEATKVRVIGTNKSARVVGASAGSAFFIMDPGVEIFNAGEAVEWLVNGSWVRKTGGNVVIERVYPLLSDTLQTNEFGEVGGVFNIPNNDNIRFNVGERIFRVASSIGKTATSAAEFRYTAIGLAMSTQQDIVSTRTQTVSVSPVQSYEFNEYVEETTDTQTTTVTKDVTVTCGNVILNSSKQTGTFTYDLDFGTDKGECGINFLPTGVPNRYTIVWNGNSYTSGFRGDSSYNNALSAAGYPTVATGTDANNPASGKLRFNKTEFFPTTAKLTVEAPLQNDEWKWKMVCPGKTDDLIPDPDPVPAPAPGGSTGGTGSGGASTGNGNTPITVTLNAPSTWNNTVKFKESRESVQQNISDGFSRTADIYQYSFRVEPIAGILPAGTPIQINTATHVFPAGRNGGELAYQFAGFDVGEIYKEYSTSPNTWVSYNGQVIKAKVGDTISIRYNFAKLSYSRTVSLVPLIAQLRDDTPPADYAFYIQGEAIMPEGYLASFAYDSKAVVATAVWNVTFNNVNDPIAQTFTVNPTSYPDGVFVDKLDVYFRSKENNPSYSVRCELRPTVNGYPSANNIIPLGTAYVSDDEIAISADTDEVKAATTFVFQGPVYLSPGVEYAFVVIAPTDKYEVYTSRLGEPSLANPNVRSTTQPVTGVMFTSANGGTWSPVQEEDINFRIHRCVFDTTTQRTITLNGKTNVTQKASDNIDYDLFFMDGEVLDFSSTNVNYYVKPSQFAGENLISDPAFLEYQLGSNLNFANRKSLDPNSDNSIQVRCELSSKNSAVSPVLDLSRLSATLVQNLINDNTNSEDVVDEWTVASLYADATKVYVNTSSAHSLALGDYVFVSLSPNPEFSGYHVVTEIVDTDTFAFARKDGLTAAVGSSGSPVAQEGNVRRDPQALARYITRKVTLSPEFLSNDIAVSFYANIPDEAEVIPYYRVTSLSDEIIEDNEWIQMRLASTGVPTPNGFVEYKYKAAYDLVDETVALPTGEQFRTFAVKLVMTSSNPARVPLVKELRVLALDD